MNKNLNLVAKFATTSADTEDRIRIEGYANTTSKDRQGDIIPASAWKSGMDNYLKNPIVLAYHDHEHPIGTVVDYNITDAGLQIIAEISKTAGEVYDLIKDGILKAFSVGFRVKNADYHAPTDTFLISELELYEISVVSVPANADSLFSVAKCFSEENDYAEFKKAFSKPLPTAEVQTAVVDSTPDKALELVASLENIVDKLAAKAADSEKLQMTTITTQDTGSAELLAALQKKLEDQAVSFDSALKSMKADLDAKVAEKDSELSAIIKSKMQFADRSNSAPITDRQKEDAVLLAKALGKSIDQTKFGAALIEKAGVHIAPLGAEWETVLSNNIYQEMTANLVVESLFPQVRMTAPTMIIPVNSDPTTMAEWIGAASYQTADYAAPGSTGTAFTHTINTERTLQAYKLAAKDTIGDEEEEDSMLAIMPIVRDAIVKRMAFKADQSILLSTGTDAGVTIFKGLATMAADGTATSNAVSVATGSVTVNDLHLLRKKLGRYGINPRDIVYVVSVDAYFDLINNVGAADTAGIVTVDKYGPQATIHTGEVASLWGSPIVVSTSFAAKAQGAAWGVAVNASNFLRGTLRDMRMETERSVQAQRRLLVATRRMGFMQMIANKAVSAGVYAA